ncbi:MAG: dynamin family protein [Oscillospiraceae bacterium]|nr:dynamin family protein [Oscillospiraceae bacterium]
MDEFANFKNLEFKLYECLSQIRSMCASKEIPGVRELDDVLERIKTRIFSIAVMGEFKRGKSTFINALLGTRLLPADVTPTTATVNRIIYGDEPGVTIKYKDGKETPVALSQLSEYVTKLTEEAERRAAEIESAVIRYPTALCANHIEIIDTPGLNDDAAMTEVSMSVAKRVDAVILVISALSPFSELETMFAARLVAMENIDALFFVVSFIDQIDEPEREPFLEKLKGRIVKALHSELEQSGALDAKSEKILGDLNLCAVSSTAALDALTRGDNRLLKKSNLETLKTNLFQFLTASQGYSLIQKSRAAASKYCALLNSANSKTAEKLEVRSEWFKTAGARLIFYRDQGEAEFRGLRGRFDDISSGIVQKINREKNACAKRCMGVMGGMEAFDEFCRFTDFTISESETINSGLTAELISSVKESMRSVSEDFNSLARGIVDEVLSANFEASGKKLRSLGCFSADFDITRAVWPPGFKWMADESAPPGQMAWLAKINASFRAFVENWTKYIDELFGMWENWIGIEQSRVVRPLLGELEKTHMTHNAQKNLMLKSLEKERAKLDEIQKIID